MFHHFLSGFSSTLAHPPGICKASPYQAQYGVYNKEDEAKENLSEIVDFLHHPDKYAKIGVKMPKGVLLGGDTSLACAPETQKYIDAKVVSVVKEQHAKAKKMLEDHRPALDALAQYLYEKETITGKEFMDILGKCSC